MLKRVILMLFVVCTVASAESKPASDESIHQLLEVTNARKVVDTVMDQMNGMMRNSMQQSLRGQPITPKQQQILQDMQMKVVAILKDELSWDKLEPMYLRVYRESFTQEEVDGMLAFYKTPAGQAMINKLPIVMQHSITEMQQMMGPILQRLKVLQAETTRALQDQSEATPVPAH